jgi:hypothetical protein
MDWPKSVGKGVETYVEEEHSRLKRAEFEREIRAFVGSLAAKLTTDDYQVLFEIADEYARRESFLISIRNGNFLLHEWQAKDVLISKARDLSSRFTAIVKSGLADQRQPLRLLAHVRLCDYSGRHRPHPRHWQALAELAGVSEG